jgi:WD40 repeat protein
MHGFALTLVLHAASFAPAIDPLPPGAVLRLGETRFRAQGEIRHLRFSPDGTVLFGWAIGLEGQYRPVAWKTSSGTSIPPTGNRFPPDLPERTTPAIRLTGDRVVTAGPGCAARVWDAATGRQLALLTGHSGPVSAVAVSHDEKRLATGSADGLIKLWDAESFHPIAALGGHTGAVQSIRVAANGARAVTVGEDRSVRVWDLKNGKELRGFHASGTVELTSDGTAVVMPTDKGTIVRDVLTGLEVVPSCQPECPTPTLTELLSRLGITMAFSPDGRTIAAGHPDGTIGIYEAATGQCRRMLVGHRSSCRALTFIPDGSRLLSAGADHVVLIWAVRLQDLPLSEMTQHERRAGKLWTILTTGSADAAYQAMARFAAEPPAAIKMARLRLKPAETIDTYSEEPLADARVVELLESLGTGDSRQFLEELADGTPTAHLTREAKRSLERLGWKK